MAAYTIHEPIDPPAGLAARADAVAFVKEGIAWLALIFPLLWLLYHRMWIVLAGYVVAVAILEAGLGLVGVGQTPAGWCTLLFSIAFALLANDLRRWTLARRGYRTSGAITGKDREEAELKFFSTWPETAEVSAPPPSVKPTVRPSSSTEKREGGDEEVIGLFPDADR